MFGPFNSNLVLASLPVLNEAKIASITEASSPTLTPEAGPYHFSTTYPVSISAAVIERYAREVMKLKSVAILSDSGTASKEIVGAMKVALDKNGIAVAAQEFQATDTDMTPQLLSLRKADPEALIAFTNNGFQNGTVLKNLSEIGWNVRVMGSSTMTLLTQPAIKIAGPDAYKNVLGVNNAAFTYCTGDALDSAAYAKFRKKLQAFDPANFAQYIPTVAVYAYDAPYIFKAAIEGSGGKTDGPTVAAWIEQNGQSLNIVSGKAEPSKTHHFMQGPSAMVLVEHPDVTREDGLQKRFGC
jgi:ABC-type branched-subunit amino acid transport system substrate-binding protein